MACDCSWCDSNKHIGTLRALQPEEGRCLRKSKYPSKSKKVYMDRYLAARKMLMSDIERYKIGWERGYTDSWFYSRVKRNEWGVKKYREARAKCKELGLL